jgi:hypothetical protein
MATSKQVTDSIRRILDMCGKTLIEKGNHYAGEDRDRLKNFKAGAALNGNDNCKTVLWGYLVKHLVSIQYMCRMTRNKPDRAQWDEKLGDAINYLLLLSAMVDEEIANEVEGREPSKVWMVHKTKRSKAEDIFIKEALHE